MTSRGEEESTLFRLRPKLRRGFRPALHFLPSDLTTFGHQERAWCVTLPKWVKLTTSCVLRIVSICREQT